MLQLPKMKLTFIQCILCVAALLSPSVTGYRILGVFPFSGKSHNIVFEALMKGLAKHGHQVDVVSHFPLKTPTKNYNDIISLEGAMEALVNNFTIEFVSQMDGCEIVAEPYGNRLCHFLGFEKMQQLIKNPPTDPPYDIVITEAFGANCYFGLGYVFKVPVVAVSSSIEYPWISHYTGNDDNLAYVPNAFHVGTKQMNFYERLKNVISNFYVVYLFHSLTDKSQTDSMRKYLSPDIPNIREVEKNIALTLVNRNPILSGIKPVTPSLIEIAGLHINRSNQTIPTELKKWMDESKSGVVYFTLGSMVLVETLPINQLKEIYDSFEKIAPVRVLMKIVNSTKLPGGLPKNVKVLSWIPQQAVLAHPNTKIFVNHGGLGGIQEALYYGIPMIGIPLFGDQFRNVQSFVDKQIMIRIDLEKLSEKSLDSALNALLHDSTYKKKASYYSKLFRDEPYTPMNRAIFWIEYVIRNGADVLKSPALELSFIQLALLDVYLFILLSFIVCFSIFMWSLKLILKSLLHACSRKTNDSLKRKKSKKL